MRLLTPKKLSCAWTPSSLPGVGLQMVLVSKATFDLATGEPAAEPVLVSGDLDDGEPVYASDFAPYKPKADIIVRATAHAPEGGAEYLQVGFAVGGLQKKLLVVGDRAWRRGLLGWDSAKPSRFETMPMRWSRAFGGPGDDTNPVGCGRAGDRLPNIEWPDKLIQSPRDAIAAAGIGATSTSWLPRRSMVGSYGGSYLKKHWPWFPADFDYAYFNAAPADQQVAGFLRGDEELRFENLHRQHRVLTARLPSVRSRLFLTTSSGEFREVPQRLDTLFCDLEQDRLILVWRGHTAATSPMFHDVVHVLATLEPLAQPLDAEHYRKLRDDSLKSIKRAAAPSAAPAEAVDPEQAAARAAFAKEVAEAEQIADAAILAQQQSLLEQGIAPPPATGVPTDVRAAIAAALPAPMPALAPASPALPPLPGVPESEIAEMEAMIASAEARQKERAPTEPWTRDSVVATHAAGRSLSGGELVGLDLSGLDLHGANLSGANLANCNLQGTNLAAADLTAAILTAAKLGAVNFTAATLDRADLTGAQAPKSRWQKASLVRTILTGLVAAESDFRDSTGKATQWSKADLRGCSFAGSAFTQADFTGCKLAGADFTGATLRDARMHAVDAAGACFRSADCAGLRADDGAVFTKADFRRTQLAGCVVEFAHMRGCDLRHAQLQRALLTGCDLSEADLSRADLTRASLADANLVGARLLQSNLLRASLDRCNLTRANLRAANLYAAGLWDAELDGAELRDANIAATLLVVR